MNKFAITLTENDVPGAKLKSKLIEEHSICELQRWLQCRGLPTSGVKAELEQRCKNCIASGQDGDILIAVDGGTWYQRKVARVLNDSAKENVPDVPVLPVTGWGKFPSKTIPKGFCYGSIYDHIIATACVTENDGSVITTDFATSKPMTKGRQYFASGHVKNMKDSSSKNCYFLKSTVMASFQPTKSRNVSITLDQASGKILDASCDCEASSMRRCNHIAALLFALEDFTIQFGFDPESSTGQLCVWNKGRKSKRDPQKCHTASYSKKLKLDRLINYDPRPENMRMDDDAFFNTFVTTLPNAGGGSMFEQMIEPKYEDYDVDKENLQLITNSVIQQIRRNYSGHQPVEISGTQDQHESALWHQCRFLRVTASNSKNVCSTKSASSQYNLLKRILWGRDRLDLKSFQYGRKNEAEAFDKFRECFIDPNMSVTKSGFWINPNFPELGCSPDGLIYDDHKKLVGLLEIKCPSSLENMDPLQIEKLTKSQKNSLSYKVENGQIQLKNTHAYYYQVQMQMGVCNVKFCDFFIWTNKGCAKQKILHDPVFWSDLKEKLLHFHHKVLVPEYIEMRIPRRLLPVSL